MKSDLTRDTYDPAKHFSRVIMQQGRVSLDADHNEQVAILLDYIRGLARDLIGPHGAPAVDGGFTITQLGPPPATFTIGKGRYYVDGRLIQNESDCQYNSQPDYPIPSDDPLVAGKQGRYWVYLDVWERNVTTIEDADIREVALGGPDTCTRAHIVWQVRVLPAGQPTQDAVPVDCNALLTLLPPTTAALAARLDPGQATQAPCVLPPDAAYRGAENQLYRVEIHDAGQTAQGATFKWSRDNGSVATTWLGTSGNDLQVGSTRGFAAGNWVELSDDTLDLQGEPGVFVHIAKVEPGTLSLDPTTSITLPWTRSLKHPKVRRWDQVETEDTKLPHGAMAVLETPTDSSSPVWIDLEDGIQVQFRAGGDYRTGDYWLIPARAATGRIDWPMDQSGQGLSLPPRGVEHHYAPLGVLNWSGTEATLETICRHVLNPAANSLHMSSGS